MKAEKLSVVARAEMLQVEAGVGAAEEGWDLHCERVTKLLRVTL